MAITSLANIIEPTLFAQYIAEAVVAKSALLSSGAVMTSDQLSAYCAQGGRSAHLPNFSDLAWSAPDIATDDTTAASVNNMISGEQTAQKDFLSKTWGTAALTESVSGADIVGHIVNNVVAPYWAQTFQQYALAKVSGVLKDNAANDDGDMILNVANDASTAILAAESANVGNIIEARQSLGDRNDRVNLIVMHSRVYSNLLKLEPTNFAPPSSVRPFLTYMDMKVIVDDTMPVTAGTNRSTYTTLLLGDGALLMGESIPESGAVGVFVNPTAGNGFSTETLTSRKQIILHPAGFASSAALVTHYGSPTLSAYDTASAWNRIFKRKNVPIVALKTNA